METLRNLAKKHIYKTGKIGYSIAHIKIILTKASGVEKGPVPENPLLAFFFF